MIGVELQHQWEDGVCRETFSGYGTSGLVFGREKDLLVVFNGDKRGHPHPHGIQTGGGRGFEVTRPLVAFTRSFMVRIFAIQVVAIGI